MKAHVRRMLLGCTTLLVVGSLAVGTPAAWSAAHDEAPLSIDLRQDRITDALGNELAVTHTDGDEGESTSRGTTVSGEPFVVLRQGAPTDESADASLATEPADLTTEARSANGSLPPELVGTDYVDGAIDQVVREEVVTTPTDPLAFTLRFVQALTPHTASFAWKPHDEAASTRIVRDGTTIAEVTSTSFSESGLETSRRYEYQFLSLDAGGEVIGVRMVPATPPVSSAPPRTARTFQPWVSGFVYRTFIPDARVDMDLMTTMGCGQAGKSGMTFGGDGRSWVTPPYNTPWDATKFRTSVFVNVNWDNAAPYDVVTVKEVRPTTLYQNGVLKEQRTASADGIRFSNLSASSNYAQAYINHAVGNPFCAAGAITYNAWARFYRSGTFEVSGSRFPVPAHEIYGGWDDGNGNKVWRPLARLGNEGFACLTGLCGSKQVYGSATY